MVRNLILSGGVAHDFPVTSQALAGVLAEAGIESEITEDLAGALAGPLDAGLVTVNAFRWRMDGGDFAGERDRWRFELPERARDALLAHLAGGGGLLAVHTASICFDDWPDWPRIVGGSWRWGTTYHPALGPAVVRTGEGHPIVDGVGGFELVDEVYTDLDVLPGVEPLAYARARQEEHGEPGTPEQPVLWARAVGGGRVVYDALGHDARSYESPAHRTLLRRAALWALGKD